MRLNLTRRTDYAVRAMLVLARNPHETISSAGLAAQTHIPLRFVNQVMGDLVRAGLVQGIIGRLGGYRLSADPRTISVLDIVEAVEGDAGRQQCVLHSGPCPGTAACEIHHVFAAARQAFIGELAGTSLATVAATEPTEPTAGD